MQYFIFQVLMLFVAVYIIQYWAIVVYALCDVFGTPNYGLAICCVLFGNMGGLFNFVAYTLVRKRQQSVDDMQPVC